MVQMVVQRYASIFRCRFEPRFVHKVNEKHLLKSFPNGKTRIDVIERKPGTGFTKPCSAAVVTSCMLLPHGTALAQIVYGSRVQSPSAGEAVAQWLEQWTTPFHGDSLKNC